MFSMPFISFPTFWVQILAFSRCITSRKNLSKTDWQRIICPHHSASMIHVPYKVLFFYSQCEKSLDWFAYLEYPFNLSVYQELNRSRRNMEAVSPCKSSSIYCTAMKIISWCSSSSLSSHGKSSSIHIPNGAFCLITYSRSFITHHTSGYW